MKYYYAEFEVPITLQYNFTISEDDLCGTPIEKVCDLDSMADTIYQHYSDEFFELIDKNIKLTTLKEYEL